MERDSTPFWSDYCFRPKDAATAEPGVNLNKGNSKRPHPQTAQVLRRLETRRSNGDGYEAELDEEQDAQQQRQQPSFSRGHNAIFSKNVASTGPTPIMIHTIQGDFHIGDRIDINATAAGYHHPATTAAARSKNCNQHTDRSSFRQLTQGENDHIRKANAFNFI
jgi:hypothetical protein